MVAKLMYIIHTSVRCAIKIFDVDVLINSTIHKSITCTKNYKSSYDRIGIFKQIYFRENRKCICMLHYIGYFKHSKADHASIYIFLINNSLRVTSPY